MRCLEALRRAGVVERVDADHWRIPEDFEDRGRHYDNRRGGQLGVRMLSTSDLDAQGRRTPPPGSTVSWSPTHRPHPPGRRFRAGGARGPCPAPTVADGRRGWPARLIRDSPTAVACLLPSPGARFRRPARSSPKNAACLSAWRKATSASAALTVSPFSSLVVSTPWSSAHTSSHWSPGGRSLRRRWAAGHRPCPGQRQFMGPRPQAWARHRHVGEIHRLCDEVGAHVRVGPGTATRICRLRDRFQIRKQTPEQHGLDDQS